MECLTKYLINQIDVLMASKISQSLKKINFLRMKVLKSTKTSFILDGCILKDLMPYCLSR